jgi:hypothetical protein
MPPKKPLEPDYPSPNSSLPEYYQGPQPLVEMLDRVRQAAPGFIARQGPPLLAGMVGGALLPEAMSVAAMAKIAQAFPKLAPILAKIPPEMLRRLAAYAGYQQTLGVTDPQSAQQSNVSNLVGMSMPPGVLSTMVGTAAGESAQTGEVPKLSSILMSGLLDRASTQGGDALSNLLETLASRKGAINLTPWRDVDYSEDNLRRVPGIRDGDGWVADRRAGLPDIYHLSTENEWFPMNAEQMNRLDVMAYGLPMQERTRVNQQLGMPHEVGDYLPWSQSQPWANEVTNNLLGMLNRGKQSRSFGGQGLVNEPQGTRRLEDMLRITGGRTSPMPELPTAIPAPTRKPDSYSIGGKQVDRDTLELLRSILKD